jgi:hypothetical protein
VAETYPLPRSSYKLLRLILIGFLHEGGNDRKSSGPADVGRAVGLDRTLVSRNNAALAALGLLEPAEARRWKLTEGGVSVARALEYESPEEARQPLAELMRSNEYVSRVVTFVRAQGSVEEEQVVSHMARTAGVKRSSEFLTGARALLELMQIAGLVENEGGAVRVPVRRESAAPAAPDTSPPAGIEVVRPERTGSIGVTGGGSPVSLTVRVNVSPSDLKTDQAADALAARVKRLLTALQSG